MLDFIKNISSTELLIIGAVLLIFFGSRVVTNMAKGAGETLKEVKKIKRSFNEALEDDAPRESQKGVA